MSYYKEKKTANDQYPFISKDVFDLIYLRLYGRIKAVMDGGVGGVQFFLSTSIPANFCIADGRMIKRFKPEAEFGVGVKVPFFDTHGEKFGAGDTTTTIQVPDLSDQFVRMNAKDGRLPGGLQDENLKEHQHGTPMAVSGNGTVFFNNNDNANNVWLSQFGAVDFRHLTGLRYNVNDALYIGDPTITVLSGMMTTGKIDSFTGDHLYIDSKLAETENRPKNAYLVAAIKLAPEGYDFNWNKITESTTWDEIEHLGLEVMSKEETNNKILATYDHRGVLPPKDAIMAIDYKQGVCSKDIQPIGYSNRKSDHGVNIGNESMCYQLLPGYGILAGTQSKNIVKGGGIHIGIGNDESLSNVKYNGVDPKAKPSTSPVYDVDYGEAFNVTGTYIGGGVPFLRVSIDQFSLSSVSNVHVYIKSTSNNGMPFKLYNGSTEISPSEVRDMCGYSVFVWHGVQPGSYELDGVMWAVVTNDEYVWSFQELCIDVHDELDSIVSSIPVYDSRDAFILEYNNPHKLNVYSDTLYMIKDIWGKVRGKDGVDAVESVNDVTYCVLASVGSHANILDVLVVSSDEINQYLIDGQFNRLIINKTSPNDICVYINGVDISQTINIGCDSWTGLAVGDGIANTIIFDHAPRRNSDGLKYHYTPNTVIGMNILGKGRILTDEEVKLYSENEIVIPHSADDETGGLAKQLENLSSYNKSEINGSIQYVRKDLKKIIIEYKADYPFKNGTFTPTANTTGFRVIGTAFTDNNPTIDHGGVSSEIKDSVIIIKTNKTTGLNGYGRINITLEKLY